MVLQDRPAHKDHRVLMVLLVPLDLRVQLARKARKARKDLMVLPGQLDHRVLRDLMV
jgi:hypothetical protein